MSLNIETDFPYVIRLYRDSKCQEKFIASGLLIGQKHVLTCAHVADKRNAREKWYAKDCNENIATVVHFDFLEEDERKKNPVGHVDLALLELASEFGGTRQTFPIAPATILHGLTDLRRDIDPKDLRAVGGIDLDSTDTRQIESIVFKRDGTPFDLQVVGGFWEGYSGCPVVMPYDRKWVCIGIAWMGREAAATSRILTGDTVYRFLQTSRQDLLDAGGVHFLNHSQASANAGAEPFVSSKKGAEIAYDDLFVQLFVPTDHNQGRIGTAFPVAKNVLLTSAHVVGNAHASDVEARWWHLADGDCNAVSCDKILWDGRRKSPPSDVVLLSCHFPAQAEGYWGRLAAIPPKGERLWKSVGFPFFGARETSPVLLGGMTHAMDEGAVHFSLSRLEKSEGWNGGSGSPVFVNESLVGVIVDTPESSHGTPFKASTVIRLLEDADFCTFINYSAAEDQRRQLVDAAVDVLFHSEEGLKRLCHGRRLPAVSDRRTMAQQIVNELLVDANPIDVAIQFVKAMRDIPGLDDLSSKTRASLMGAAMHLIPASLTRMHVPQIRVVANDGVQQFAFHASTKTFVEVAIARLHGRPARYHEPGERQNQADEPLALLRLQKPVEAEIDKDATKFKQDFLSGLRHAMALRQLPNADFEAQVAQINRALELRKKLEEALHYYVFEYPRNDDERARRLPIIRELDRLLPLMTFIGIEQGQASDTEDNCVELVIRILFAAAVKEWKEDVQNQIP